MSEESRADYERLPSERITHPFSDYRQSGKHVWQLWGVIRHYEEPHRELCWHHFVLKAGLLHLLCWSPRRPEIVSTADALAAMRRGEEPPRVALPDPETALVLNDLATSNRRFGELLRAHPALVDNTAPPRRFHCRLSAEVEHRSALEAMNDIAGRYLTLAWKAVGARAGEELPAITPDQAQSLYAVFGRSRATETAHPGLPPEPSQGPGEKVSGRTEKLLTHLEDAGRGSRAQLNLHWMNAIDDQALEEVWRVARPRFRTAEPGPAEAPVPPRLTAWKTLSDHAARLGWPLDTAGLAPEWRQLHRCAMLLLTIADWLRTRAVGGMRPGYVPFNCSYSSADATVSAMHPSLPIVLADLPVLLNAAEPIFNRYVGRIEEAEERIMLRRNRLPGVVRTAILIAQELYRALPKDVEEAGLWLLREGPHKRPWWWGEVKVIPPDLAGRELRRAARKPAPPGDEKKANGRAVETSASTPPAPPPTPDEARPVKVRDGQVYVNGRDVRINSKKVFDLLSALAADRGPDGITFSRLGNGAREAYRDYLLREAPSEIDRDLSDSLEVLGTGVKGDPHRLRIKPA